MGCESATALCKARLRSATVYHSSKAAFTNVNYRIYCHFQGSGNQLRSWLFASDAAEGLCAVLTKGVVGAVYNIGTDFEMSGTTSVIL